MYLDSRPRSLSGFALLHSCTVDSSVRISHIIISSHDPCCDSLLVISNVEVVLCAIVDNRRSLYADIIFSPVIFFLSTRHLIVGSCCLRIISIAREGPVRPLVAHSGCGTVAPVVLARFYPMGWLSPIPSMLCCLARRELSSPTAIDEASIRRWILPSPMRLLLLVRSSKELPSTSAIFLVVVRLCPP